MLENKTAKRKISSFLNFEVQGVKENFLPLSYDQVRLFRSNKRFYVTTIQNEVYTDWIRWRFLKGPFK